MVTKANLNLKIKLLENGIKQKEIAEKAGVNETLICNIIAGRSKSKRVISFIEDYINKLEEKK